MTFCRWIATPQTRTASLRAVCGGRVWLHCRSTEQSEREAQEIKSGRPVSFSPTLDADLRASVSRKQFLSVVGVYDQVWESDQV